MTASQPPSPRPGKPDLVNHPPHYNSHPAGIECIDVIEPFVCNVANAIKYLWRAGLKPGADTVTDLEKARWYINREIERLALDRPDDAGRRGG